MISFCRLESKHVYVNWLFVTFIHDLTFLVKWQTNRQNFWKSV